MDNPSQGDTAHPAVARRAATATVLGALLFAAGYGVYRSGVIDAAYGRLGGQVVAKTAAAPYSRADMEAARKAYAKDPKAPAPRMPVGADGYFIPPPESELPEGAYGDAIRRGRELFMRPGVAAKEYVGNAMACVNCHLDAGRRENAAPMWAAYVSYPAFRKKTGSVSTLEDRIQGCFMYSMNAQASPAGKAPPAGDDIYRDLMTYMAWLADGAPTGTKLRGAVYPVLAKPEKGYDLSRGLIVYQQNCALCHGTDGQGQRDAAGAVKFPPLWGPHSYNWGAGMARIDTAAGFIRANMPLGKPYSLSEQDAWDVAAFLNSHERPKDPRQKGTVEEATKKFHAGEQSYYGKTVDGKLIGGGTDAAPGT